MSRLSLGAFGALVVATVGAFFVTQHLKVTTPVIAGLTPPGTSGDPKPFNRRNTFPTVARASKELDGRIKAKWSKDLPKDF